MEVSGNILLYLSIVNFYSYPQDCHFKYLMSRLVTENYCVLSF